MPRQAGTDPTEIEKANRAFDPPDIGLYVAQWLRWCLGIAFIAALGTRPWPGDSQVYVLLLAPVFFALTFAVPRRSRGSSGIGGIDPFHPKPVYGVVALRQPNPSDESSE